ncbi:MAG TPA: hypothetical protein VMZ06_10245 [Candidatus Bathyarchaeia archaeon]|nr:hypothetical protein [Candidatus Bathyarchaeia archaeon]
MRRKVLAAMAAVLIVLAGVGANMFLSSLKEPPAQAEPRQIALRVEAMQVQPQEVPVIMVSRGETRSLNIVAISPEVSGRVVKIHPDLKVGGVIPAGEVMFEIDARDYQSHLEEANANAEMNRQTIERLRRQFKTDQDRLDTFERSRELARAEHERLKELFEKDEVGTRSAVEQAERAYNAAADQADQMAQALALYPVRIQEAESALKAAQARRDLAEVALERTVVKAPFNARVQAVTLEKNMFVVPGANLLTLANDSILEISVPLDSREARKWLQFKDQEKNPEDAWFRDVEPVPAEIRWTEDSEGHVWTGILHRVEKFDDQTRTVTVAVRISGENARSRDDDGLPLVQGMFCEVRIPGRAVEGAYRIPASAVSFDGVAYLAVDGRLKAVRLTRELNIGEEAIITEGLKPGDIVVTTRLVNPLENTPLEIVKPAGSQSAPGAESPAAVGPLGPANRGSAVQ